MPLHAWTITGRGTRSKYDFLKASDLWPSERLVSNQVTRLQKLLEYCFESVPYYQKIAADLGCHFSDFKSLEDLASIPLLTKDAVSTNLNTDLRPTRRSTEPEITIVTSGSTGTPFTLYANQNQLEWRFAATLRALEWTGWRFGDKQTRLWHQTIGMSKAQVRKERLDALLLRRQFIPAFELEATTLNEQVKRIEKHNPVLIDGYAESLNYLAQYLHQEPSSRLNPKAVMSSAQALPDSVRDVLQRHFGCQVYDKYGSREFSGIAYEKGDGNGHYVLDETYIVELLCDGRPARPGEIGEIIVTDLFNTATPLIRYRIGDLAVALPEGDSRQMASAHSRIGRIEGRTTALVHCDNGVWLPGTFFAHFFKEYARHVKHFQVVQEHRGAFDVKIVKTEDCSADDIALMEQNLRQYVGNTVMNFILVDRIPLVRTGKMTPVVSNIRVDFQGLKQ